MRAYVRARVRSRASRHAFFSKKCDILAENRILRRVTKKGPRL